MVGYSGSYDSAAKDPTYANIQDFAECIRVIYDPSAITYKGILAMFFRLHEPSDRKRAGSQYRSAVFYHSDEQKDVAEALLKLLGEPISSIVSIERAGEFYRAEEYHQKYIEKTSR